ncbi:Trichohyalin, putative [Eimeria tenella]|uniref:Trichohyalin, putative n=1 Tax=Eimeria tenella TaxID=5802 RepID=U6KHV2_EIMTE|nr:Trichohyalin, putative [Eimeria tenella]CDJ37519.1 Trichohyalin, putative [Eimeria tenella]|eukprot:XP_013228357.1 Trichohyalin, putative [Eimeria tenella]
MSSPLDELADVFITSQSPFMGAQKGINGQEGQQNQQSVVGETPCVLGGEETAISSSAGFAYAYSPGKTFGPASSDPTDIAAAASAREADDAFGDWTSAPQVTHPIQQQCQQQQQQQQNSVTSGAQDFRATNVSLQSSVSGSFAELLEPNINSNTSTSGVLQQSPRVPLDEQAQLGAAPDPRDATPRDCGDAFVALGAAPPGSLARAASFGVAAASATATGPHPRASQEQYVATRSDPSEALKETTAGAAGIAVSGSLGPRPASAAATTERGGVGGMSESEYVHPYSTGSSSSGFSKPRSAVSGVPSPASGHQSLSSDALEAPVVGAPATAAAPVPATFPASTNSPVFTAGASTTSPPTTLNLASVQDRESSKKCATECLQPSGPATKAAYASEEVTGFTGGSNDSAPEVSTSRDMTGNKAEMSTADFAVTTDQACEAAPAPTATPVGISGEYRDCAHLETEASGPLPSPRAEKANASATATAADAERSAQEAETAAAPQTGTMCDWEAVEKLSQKYRQLKKQNALLKEALRQQQQQQQQGQKQPQQQQQQQEEPLGLVSQLQQQVALGEFRQRQLLDDLDTAQRELKRQQQQLQQQQQQLQQQHLLLLKTGAANPSSAGGPGSSWGLSLLGGGSAAAKDAELKALQQQVEVLGEELQLKIEENERLHLEAFEERQQQQQQQQQLEATIRLLQQQQEAAQQQQQQQTADYAEQQREYERLQQQQVEKMRQLQQELENAHTQQQLLLRQAVEDREQLLLREQQQQQEQQQAVAYYSTLLGCDYSRIPLLHCLDLPSGGCAAAAATAAAAQEELLRLIVASLGDLRHLLLCWAAGLEVSAGATDQGGEGLPPSDEEGALSDADTPANRLPHSLGLSWRVRTATRQARRAAFDSVASITAICSLLEHAAAAVAVASAEPLTRRANSNLDICSGKIQEETRRFGVAFSCFISLTLLAVSLQHDALNGPQQHQRQQLDAKHGEHRGSNVDPFMACLEDLQRDAAALSAVAAAAFEYMGEQPSSSGDDGTAAYTDALSEKHFLTLTAVLTNSKLEHDEKKLLVAEKCQQQQNQNGDLQSRLQQELRMPPLTLSPSKSVHAQHQGKKGRQLDLSTLFPWRGGSPLTFQLEQTEEDVPHQSECSKWLHQLRSNRGAASAGITLSEWRGAAEAKKERLLQLFFDQLKTVLQTFRNMAVCLSGRMRRPADLVDGQLLLLSGGMQCLSNIRAILLNCGQKISTRDARQVFSKRQAAEAEVAAAAADVRLLEERVAEANKAASQLREAKVAVALLQAEVARLRGGACSAATSFTTETSPTRSGSSRCSTHLEGGAGGLPVLADVPVAAESSAAVASKGSSSQGDPVVKGLALLAGPTTADAAAFIAKEADLASMAFDVSAEEQRSVYAEELLLLQQKLHAEAAALAVLRMQLSSAFKAVHALEDQRAALRQPLRDVATVGMQCLSNIRAILLNCGQKISTRDARQVFSKRQAAEAEVAAAAADVRLLEERVAEANKAASQLREAKVAVALLQAEVARLRGGACSAATSFTTETSPTRSGSSRCSTHLEGGAGGLPVLADVPVAAESSAAVASKGSSSQGDPVVKGLALLAGPTTADAAAFIAKEADLASMAFDVSAEEQRSVYAEELLLLQQKLHAEAAALAVLRMQLSSAFKAVHALEDQRAALRRELRRSKEAGAAAAAAAVAAATETAASARLAEENYSQQLRLLSLHVAETHEKSKEKQKELEDLLKHKILCGRCGVWNPLSDLLVEGQSWGSCAMCRGRVTERPF